MSVYAADAYLPALTVSPKGIDSIKCMMTYIEDLTTIRMCTSSFPIIYIIKKINFLTMVQCDTNVHAVPEVYLSTLRVDPKEVDAMKCMSKS